ncbi:MAG TPA: TetR/AcrR family transcriptional regulator [Planctomycetota bacterium]
MEAPDTKTRILDAAESLFATRGVEASSLREITASAGVNLAAVNYHFGSKDDLVLAAFRRRIGPVNRERLERLDALEVAANGRAIALEELVEAFLAPSMRFLSPDRRLHARLLGRVHHEAQDELQTKLTHEFEQVVHRFVGALSRALPRLGPAELLLRGHFMVGAMIYTLTHLDKLETVAPVPLHIAADQVLPQMIAFVAAGLRAPVPDRTEVGR